MTALTSVIGTEAWWQSVAQQGTPFIAREKGENALVTFLWRDPDGDEFHSAIRNVWLNIIGITDHHRGGLPHSLKRIAGTDVWQTTLSLSQGWRGSYSLMPDTADELPAEPLSMLSLRQWWQRKFRWRNPIVTIRCRAGKAGVVTGCLRCICLQHLRNRSGRLRIIGPNP